MVFSDVMILRLTLKTYDRCIVYRDGRFENRDISGTFRGNLHVPVPRDVPELSTLYSTFI